jgi:hypothetical protein
MLMQHLRGMQDLLLRVLSLIGLFSRSLKRLAINGQVDAALAELPQQPDRLLLTSTLRLTAHQLRPEGGFHLLAVQTHQRIGRGAGTGYAFPG